MSLEKELEILIPKTSKVLDIGCGNKNHSNYSINTTTIDAWEKVNPDILTDVTKDFPVFKDNEFDIVTMIDFIEHLEKEDGYKVLEESIRISKRVIIFTPLFWDDNSENVTNKNLWSYGNPYDYHKSLWSEEDFSDWNTVRIFSYKKGSVWLGYLDK